MHVKGNNGFFEGHRTSPLVFFAPPPSPSPSEGGGEGGGEVFNVFFAMY